MYCFDDKPHIFALEKDERKKWATAIKSAEVASDRYGPNLKQKFSQLADWILKDEKDGIRVYDFSKQTDTAMKLEKLLKNIVTQKTKKEYEEDLVGGKMPKYYYTQYDEVEDCYVIPIREIGYIMHEGRNNVYTVKTEFNCTGVPSFTEK